MRLLKWGAFGVLALVIGLLAPVAYVEVACRPAGQPALYAAVLPAEDHRAEGRTLLTYPEWHIVHAYDDYAQVIETGDPHDYRYFSSIAGFWGSLCSLSRASGPHGGFPSEFKQTVYTIGVSFTVELLAKAAYEETLGRLAVWLRGPDHAPLDRMTAEQARSYSQFLRQVPWYNWDFAADSLALDRAATNAWRDQERRFAIGVEYAVKARYATVIAAAVANMEPDALRLRMVVTGLEPEALAALDGVTVVTLRPQGTEIDTVRYRALTRALLGMALAGADFVEIAGNDDILLTVTSVQGSVAGALHSFGRQGYGDYRHLMLVKVADLAEVLRGLEGHGLRLEHIHDY